MEAKDIKFRRVRVDKFIVQHWFDAGTKHLPPCYATKCYDYMVYDANGKRLSPYYKYGGLRTLKEVKEWIAKYDENFERAAAEEAAEEAAKELYWETRKNMEVNLTNSAKSYVESPKSVAVGEVGVMQVPSFNKNTTIGEYLIQFEAQYLNDFRVDVSRYEVVKVIEFTNEEYDTFIETLMDGRDIWETDEDGSIKGGSYSDDPRLPEDVPFFKLTVEQINIFRTTCRTLVHAITAPNRKTFLVNTEGYAYARYLGFI